jgi:hypothetical protein
MRFSSASLPLAIFRLQLYDIYLPAARLTGATKAEAVATIRARMKRARTMVATYLKYVVLDPERR